MVLVVLDACKTQADGTPLDASAKAPSVAPSASASATAALPPAPHDPLAGEWERQSEPYKGMRVSIRGEMPSSAVVTQPSSLGTGAGAESNALRRAQLECQRSLWKPGEVLVSGLHASGERAWEGTIVVRDWGLTAGTCRHADSRAPARITIAGKDELAIAVTRGKTVTQIWRRVAP